MVALQVISKVLNTKDWSLIDKNMLTEEYFVGYEQEYNFIRNHYLQYGNIPDVSSFLSSFPDFEVLQVEESDQYLVDTIREEFLYYKSVPVVKKIADLMQTDANAAVEYMIHSMQDLQPNYRLGGLDIIQQAQSRYEEFVERREHQDNWFIPTGFEELDEVIHGLQRGEEFLVIIARTNQGKSWVLEKMCTHIWRIGLNVGYISPEMGPSSVGYRFDTLNEHFSNKDLMWGNKALKEEEYKNYIDSLKDKKNSFLVATPIDFQRCITVSKLRNWIKQYKLDVIAIDGITYLSDERGKRGDNKTTSLTNISEDLMSLSVEMKIPIITVVQANRDATGTEDDVPELETVRDSDGIAYNASKVISIRQLKNSVLRMVTKKQRFGPLNSRLDYVWDIDKGEFVYVPSDGDAQPQEKTERQVEKIRSSFRKTDRKEVF